MSKDIKFYKNLIYGYYEQLKKEIILNLSNDNRSKNASVEYFMRIKTIKKFNYTNLEKNLDKINLTNDINLILFEKKFIFFIKSPLNKFGQLIQTDKFCTARSRKIIEKYVNQWFRTKNMIIKVNSLDTEELESYLMVKYSIDLWNQLSILELSRDNFYNLVELHLMFHQIDRIENCFGTVLKCHNLQELHLQSNGIQELEKNCFKNLTSLKILNLSKNSLKSISNCFFGLADLEHLDLSMNQIENLDKECFIDLKQLVFVNLSFNKIKLLDLNLFIECQNLLELKATNNLIAELSLDIFIRKLLVLDLKWNFIQNYKKEIFSFMPLLHSFDISFNKNFN